MSKGMLKGARDNRMCARDVKRVSSRFTRSNGFWWNTCQKLSWFLNIARILLQLQVLRSQKHRNPVYLQCHPERVQPEGAGLP